MAQEDKPKLQKILIKPPLKGLNIHDNPLDLNQNFAYELTNYLPPTTYLEVRPAVKGLCKIQGASLGMHSYSVGARKVYGSSNVVKMPILEDPCHSDILIKVKVGDGIGAYYIVTPSSLKYGTQNGITPVQPGRAHCGSYNSDWCMCNISLYFTEGNGADSCAYIYSASGSGKDRKTKNPNIVKMAWKSPETSIYKSGNITDIENITIYNEFFFANCTKDLNVFYIPVLKGDPSSKDAETWVESIFNPAVTGIINLSGVLQRGGSIMKMFTMSAAKENNLKQYFCIITSLGELLVYKGTNPADLTKWELDGNFRVPIPINKRCFCEVEGDMIIATETGLVSLQRIIFGSKTNITEAIETRLSGLFKRYEFRMNAHKEQIFLSYYSERRLVIFNIPEMLPSLVSDIKYGYEIDTTRVMYILNTYFSDVFFINALKDFITTYVYKYAIDYSLRYEFDGNDALGIIFDIKNTVTVDPATKAIIADTVVRLYVSEASQGVIIQRDLIGSYGYVNNVKQTQAGIHYHSPNIVWHTDALGNYIPPAIEPVIPTYAKQGGGGVGWIGDKETINVNSKDTYCDVYHFRGGHVVTNVIPYASRITSGSLTFGNFGEKASFCTQVLPVTFTLTLVDDAEDVSINFLPNQSYINIIEVIYALSINTCRYEETTGGVRYPVIDYVNPRQGGAPIATIDDNQIFALPQSLSYELLWFVDCKPKADEYYQAVSFASAILPFNNDVLYPYFVTQHNTDPFLLSEIKEVLNLDWNGRQAGVQGIQKTISYRYTITSKVYITETRNMVFDPAMYNILGFDNDDWIFKGKIVSKTLVELIGATKGNIDHDIPLLEINQEVSFLCLSLTAANNLPEIKDGATVIRPAIHDPCAFVELQASYNSSIDLLKRGLEETFTSDILTYTNELIEIRKTITFAELANPWGILIRGLINNAARYWPITQQQNMTTHDPLNKHTPAVLGCGLWFLFFLKSINTNVNFKAPMATIHSDPKLVPVINTLAITGPYISTQYVFDTQYGTWSQWKDVNMIDATEHEDEFYFLKNEDASSPVINQHSILCKFDYEQDGDNAENLPTNTPIVCSYQSGHTDLGIGHLKKQFKKVGIYGSRSAFWSITQIPPIYFTFSLDFKAQEEVVYPYFDYTPPIGLVNNMGYHPSLAKALRKYNILKRFEVMTFQEKRKYYRIYEEIMGEVEYIEVPLVSNPANRISVGCRMNVTKHGIYVYGYELYFEEVNP